jgi:tetratricopeptide (TPR) repeat protein
METLIAWSYDLLNPGERNLFRALSVFRGEFSVEAVQLVCEAQVATLVRLVEKSMLQRSDRDAQHYRMLFALATFGRERFSASDEAAALRDRHAAYYASMVAPPDASQSRRHETAWLARVAASFEDVRAALSWTLEDAGDPAVGIAMVLSLEVFFATRTTVAQCARWVEAAMRRAGPGTAASALLQLSYARAAAGRFEAATLRIAAWESLDTLRALRCNADLPRAMTTVASMMLHEGTVDDVLPLLTQAREAALRHGDVRSRGMADSLAAYVHSRRGNPAEARVLYARALAVCEELGDVRAAGKILNNLASIEFAHGGYADAENYVQRALSIARDLGEGSMVAWRLADLGDLAVMQDDVARAEVLYREALVLAQRNDAVSTLAQALKGLAIVAAVRGEVRTAARLLGASGGPDAWLPWTRADYVTWNRASELARAGLDDAAFVAEFAVGTTLDTEAALREAGTLWDAPVR